MMWTSIGVIVHSEIDKKIKLQVKDVMDSIARLIMDYQLGKMRHTSFVGMMRSDISELERITKGL